MANFNSHVWIKTFFSNLRCFLMIVIEGEVAEWSKARAWKVRKLQKGFAGSNPAFSAGFYLKTFDNYKFLTLIIQQK